jgi:hypothetical protein
MDQGVVSTDPGTWVSAFLILVGLGGLVWRLRVADVAALRAAQSTPAAEMSVKYGGDGFSIRGPSDAVARSSMSFMEKMFVFVEPSEWEWSGERQHQSRLEPVLKAAGAAFNRACKAWQESYVVVDKATKAMQDVTASDLEARKTAVSEARSAAKAAELERDKILLDAFRNMSAPTATDSGPWEIGGYAYCLGNCDATSSPPLYALHIVSADTALDNEEAKAGLTGVLVQIRVTKVVKQDKH